MIIIEDKYANAILGKAKEIHQAFDELKDNFINSDEQCDYDDWTSVDCGDFKVNIILTTNMQNELDYDEKTLFDANLTIHVIGKDVDEFGGDDCPDLEPDNEGDYLYDELDYMYEQCWLNILFGDKYEPHEDANNEVFVELMKR